LVCSFCFFFSSRRRHTRFSRDWSSDVYSSDLGARRPRAGASELACTGRGELEPSCRGALWNQRDERERAERDREAVGVEATKERSEERRVGKEGRTRWGPEHGKRTGEGWRAG